MSLFWAPDEARPAQPRKITLFALRWLWTSLSVNSRPAHWTKWSHWCNFTTNTGEVYAVSRTLRPRSNFRCLWRALTPIWRPTAPSLNWYPRAPACRWPLLSCSVSVGQVSQSKVCVPLSWGGKTDSEIKRKPFSDKRSSNAPRSRV